MCECGRRTSGWIGLIPEVHGCDKTAVHSEYVENLAVRKNFPLKALDELVHPDTGLASIFLGYRKRFDMGIELTPLSSPVGADLVLSDDLAALRSLGPVTSCVISANAPSTSRLLNAEYACSIMALVSIHSS